MSVGERGDYNIVGTEMVPEPIDRHSHEVLPAAAVCNRAAVSDMITQEPKPAHRFKGLPGKRGDAMSCRVPQRVSGCCVGPRSREAVPKGTVASAQVLLRRTFERCISKAKSKQHHSRIIF